MREPIVRDNFEYIVILEDIICDVPPSSYLRLNLVHVQVGFLINRLEWDWKILVKWIHQLGDYESFFTFCEQLRQHVIEVYEEVLEEEMNPDD